jgi:pimeloyl-ACP methyl ester carboxylesterase
MTWTAPAPHAAPAHRETNEGGGHAPPPSRLRRRWLHAGLALSLAAAIAGACWLLFPPAVSRYRPRDPVLRSLPLYVYPAADASRPPRALVLFFGNDVGFWRPHQRLAERLADAQYTVVGVDLLPIFAHLPSRPAPRERAFASLVDDIVSRGGRELHASGAPVVIAGHSIGAEVALWAAARVHPAGLQGVVAVAPSVRGHLRATLSDRLGRGDPTEPGSFSVADVIRQVPPGVRIALVRGETDRYRDADPQLIPAGGARLQHWVVPFASHSLRNLLVAGPIVETALGWTIAPR